MAKALKKLESSTEIAAALDAARTKAEEADAGVNLADAAYKAALLTETSDALRKLVDDKVNHGIAADQARARAAKLEADLAAALAAEAEDGRAKRYAEAKALADAARKKLFGEYPKAAESIRSILRAIAEADIAVADANADLPSGAERLEAPEESRSTRYEFREELGEDRILLWAGEGAPGSPLRDGQQSQVQMRDSRRKGGPVEGWLPGDNGGGLNCVRGAFVRTKFLPDRNGWPIGSLADGIKLPALEAGNSAFWEPTSSGAKDVIRALEKPARKRPPYAPREPAYEYRLIRE